SILMSVQPHLVRSYVSSNNAQFKVGQSAQVFGEVFSNVGRSTEGIEVIVKGSALSDKLLEKPRAILSTHPALGATNQETLVLTQDKEGAWRGKLPEYPLPHGDLQSASSDQSLLVMEVWANTIHSGSGTVKGTIRTIEEPAVRLKDEVEFEREIL